MAKPLTRPYLGTRPGNKHQRYYITPPLKKGKPALRLSPLSTCLHPYIVITAGGVAVVGYRLQAEQQEVNCVAVSGAVEGQIFGARSTIWSIDCRRIGIISLSVRL